MFLSNLERCQALINIMLKSIPRNKKESALCEGDVDEENIEYISEGTVSFISTEN